MPGPGDAQAIRGPTRSRRYGVVVTDADVEVPLRGGNSSASVVRVGDTVRKPWLTSTEMTVGYLDALRQRGLDVPGSYGRDGKGRLVLDYVPGELAMDRGPLTPSLVNRIGALVREIHDQSAGLAVPPDWPTLLPSPGSADLVCHNDLAPWNLVVDGDRLVFIDWDGAGPSTRLWDLAYAATSFGHLFPGEDPAVAVVRLVAFLEGYGADAELRHALPTMMVERARAMSDLFHTSSVTGREPWASMYALGHGEHWDGTVDYIARHEAIWVDGLARVALCQEI